MHELSLQYLLALPQGAFVPYCTRTFVSSAPCVFGFIRSFAP